MSKSKRIVAPFINEFGQVIQPNDVVFAVTTCTHRTNVFEAKYVGYVEREAYDWKEKKKVMQKFAQISTPSFKTTFVKKGTNETFQWNTLDYNRPREEQYDVVKTPFNYISTLQYNRILPAYASITQLASVV